jgi:aspartate/methionine/tyrosine aminotransferase
VDINHLTAARIYRKLAELGYVTATVGRGTFVRSLAPAGSAEHGDDFQVYTLPPREITYSEAARHGVTFTPGGAITAERRSQTSFRLSFSLLEPAELDEGVRRLARAIRAVRRRARTAVAAPMS